MLNKRTGWESGLSTMRCQQNALCKPFLQQGLPEWMSCAVLAHSVASTWLSWILPLWCSLRRPTAAGTASTS